jgi:hypothetical protein
MKRIIRLLRAGLTVSLLAVAVSAHAQVELKIFTAIEVEFATERAKTYQLQGSSDLTAWTDIGDPVFGNGNTVNQVFSSKRLANVAFESYRLNVTDNPNPGLAPWSFTGLSLSLGDDGVREHYDFLTETTGVKVSPTSSDPFTYALTRTGDNEVQFDLTKNSASHPDRHDLYTFTFTTTKLGTFVREEFRDARLKDRDLGTFQVLDGSTPPPPDGTDTNSVPVTPPASLKGLAYSFQSGERPDRLEFLTETTGVAPEDRPRQDEDEPNKPFTYAYTLTTPTNATLVVSLPDNRRDEYDLTFTEGAQGTFVRREFRNDVLDDTDTGAFSPAGAATNPDGGTPPDGNGTPDASLTGSAFTFRNGESSDRLTFATETTGVEQSDEPEDDPANFTYAYTVKEGSAATLIVTFKADKWDEYDLTFTGDGQGRFERREFREGVLDDTDTGTFARVSGN